MTRSTMVVCVILGIGLTARAGSTQPANAAPAVRVMLSEVVAGSMASEQYCTLVFADRHFHSEKASRKTGKDRDRKVYEGNLSEADWNTLGAILDDKQFREINMPQGVTPLMVEDAHTYTISVARDAKFQNLEFLDNKSRKPYEAQLKPLLGWWKTFRGRRIAESNASPDSRCSLDSSHAVFSH
jgi:hypothetical protein